MTSLAIDCGTKRKLEALRNDGNRADDEDSTDEPSRIPKSARTVVGTPSSPICFMEFRRSTIRQYPTLTWLGPAVMAVYWFKEYLNKPSFGWVRCPKPQPASASASMSMSMGKRDNQRGEQQMDSTTKRHRSRRRRRQRRGGTNHSRGNFYFVPGQYLRSSNCDATGAASADGNRATSNDQATMSAIQRVLDTGTQGVHYATSYIGVYNLLRSYGRFVVLANEDVNDNDKNDDDDDDNERNFHGTASSQDGREEKGKSMTTTTTTTTKDAAPKIVPLDYHGPPLPR